MGLPPEMNDEAVALFLDAQLALQEEAPADEPDDRAERAVALLRSAIARAPRAAPLWRYLAEAQAAVPDHREAVAAALRALELDPDDPRSHWIAGSQLREIGRNEEAEPHLVAAAKGRLEGAEPYLPFYTLYLLRREQGRTDDALAALRDWATALPEDRYPHGLRHRLLWEGGRFAEARDAAVEVLRRSPSDRDAHELLSRYYRLDPDGEIATYEELLRSDWSVPELHRAVRAAYARLGRYDKAIEHLDWLRVLGRDDPVRLLEAEVDHLMKMHRADAARRRLEAGWPEETTPDVEFRLRMLLAETRRRARRWDQAVEAYRAVPTEGLVRERSQIAATIAHIRLSQGRPDLAAREAEAGLAEADPRDDGAQAGLLVAILQAQVKMRDFEAARAALGRLRGLASAADAVLEYEVTILDREGRRDEAVERLRARLRERRNHPTAVRRLSVLLAAGGDRDGARAVLDEALEPLRGLVADLGEAPPSPDVLERRQDHTMSLVSLLLHASGLAQQADDWPRAEALLLEARALVPGDATVRNALAYAYSLRGEKLDEAQALIDAALAHEPFNGAMQDTLGWVRFKRGDLAGAREALGLAVEYTPGNAEILAHLAEVHAALGETRLARDRYQEALREADEHDSYERRIADSVRQSLRALGAKAGR